MEKSQKNLYLSPLSTELEFSARLIFSKKHRKILQNHKNLKKKTKFHTFLHRAGNLSEPHFQVVGVFASVDVCSPCAVRIPFMHTVYTPCIYRLYTVHIPYMFSYYYTIHVFKSLGFLLLWMYVRRLPYAYRLYTVHIPFIYRLYTLHIPYVFSYFYTILIFKWFGFLLLWMYVRRLPYAYRLYTVHIPFIYRLYTVHIPYMLSVPPAYIYVYIYIYIYISVYIYN